MKTRLLLLSVLIPMFGFVQSWVLNTDFPGDARLGFSYFSLNDQSYIMGGLNQNNTVYTAFNELWKYNATSDTWQQLADYPGGNMYGGFNFVIDNTVYIGLGSDQNGFYNNEVWSYNELDGWLQVANFPGTTRIYPFSFSANYTGHVGAGFGSSSSLLNDFWAYDPLQDSWTLKTPYPGGGRVGNITFSIGSKGYVGLGDNNNSFFNDFYEYNPITDVWVNKSNFNGLNRSFSSSISVNDNGYILGGESVNNNMTNQMWGYNPVSDSWYSLPAFTGQARRYGALFFINDLFYYGLGQFGFNDDQVLEDFWRNESSVTSINSFSINEVSNFYPIPFQNNLSIKIEAIDNLKTIRVYNNMMQILYQGIDSNINTENWGNGVYFISIETQEEVRTHKIIKG